MQVVDEVLLDRFRFAKRCEWCNRPTPNGCDPHHLFGRGMGGGGRIDLAVTVIALCFDCHRVDLPAGNLLNCSLLAVVATREGTHQDIIRQIVGGIRRARRTNDPAERDRALVAIYGRLGLAYDPHGRRHDGVSSGGPGYRPRRGAPGTEADEDQGWLAI